MIHTHLNEFTHSHPCCVKTSMAIKDFALLQQFFQDGTS